MGQFYVTATPNQDAIQKWNELAKERISKSKRRDNNLKIS